MDHPASTNPIYSRRRIGQGVRDIAFGPILRAEIGRGSKWWPYAEQIEFEPRICGLNGIKT